MSEHSPMMVVYSALGVTWLMYTAVMFGLSIWVFRLTHVAGSPLLVVGFGGGLFLQLVSRALMPIVVNSTSEEIGSADSWFWTIQLLTSLLGLACNATIVIGFYLLCAHLIRMNRAVASPPPIGK